MVQPNIPPPLPGSLPEFKDLPPPGIGDSWVRPGEKPILGSAGSRRSKGLFIFFLCIGVFLTGGAALGYFVINEPPSQVIKLAFDRINAVDSLHSAVEVSVIVSDPSPVTVKFLAQADEVQRGTPDTKSRVLLDVIVSGGGIEGSGAAEFRTFGLHKMYAQLTKLVLPEALGEESALVDGAVAPYVNKWVKIDVDELQQFLGEKPEQKTPEQLFTPEEQERILAKLSQAVDLNLIDFEKIDTTSTFHYKITFTRPGLDDFLFELVTILSEKGTVGPGAMVELKDNPAKIKTDIKEGLDEFFENTSISAEVWVGRFDLLPRKVTTYLEVRESGKKTAQVAVEIEFSKFNDPIVIEEPQDAINLKDILTELGLLTAFSGDKDAKRQSDLVSIAAALKAYSDIKGSYPSTAGALSRMNNTNSPCRELFEEKLWERCPTDPFGPPVFYGYKSDGKTYELTAVLEDQSSPFCVLEGPACIFRIRDGEIVSRK